MKINSEKYLFTKHSLYKIKHYGLSEQRVKRIIRYPARTEEAIIPKMIAAMQPAGLKNYSEIWTIYQIVNSKLKNQNSKLRIITAWRYPGKSPARNPIPAEILNEIKSLLHL